MLNKSIYPVLGLVLGHLVTDLQGGALPVLLPFLKEAFSLSYAQLAAIVLTQNITSSVIQPVFGYLTDKYNFTFMLPICAACAGAGFSLLGWLGAYELILLTVIFIGVASATYHPLASKTVNFLSTDTNKAKNMGLFSLGGNAGMALGSVSMAFLLALEGGKHNTFYMLFPGLIVFFILRRYLPDYMLADKYKKQQLKENTQPFKLSRKILWGLSLLLIFIFLRSTIHSALSTYLPLYFVHNLGYAATFGSMLVSLFLLGGVAGTYTGAVLSDRLGARKIILGSILASIPSIGAILLFKEEFLIAAAVTAAGFFIIGSFATTIILAQNMLPNNVGMAAGLTIGFSVGMGGFGVTILGFLADCFGLTLVMHILPLLPIAAALVAFKIPLNTMRQV